jgi:hypothetical protein
VRQKSVESRLVWIFGSPRSGSTWLLNLLAAGGDAVKIDEPGIGSHLGVPISEMMSLDPAVPERFRLNDFREGAADYFFSRGFEHVWRPAVRRLLLARLGAQLGRASLAVIKEPHGSLGADLLMSILPRSRMIFLLRDGRDVVDSELDAAQPGSWGAELATGFKFGDRATYLRRRAWLWLWRTEVVQRAFEGHTPSRRRLLRYEELRASPGAVLAPLAEWVGVEPQPILDAAERSTFERQPPGERGSGRFLRAARPGVWRENLTEEEQAEVSAIIGPKLRELGYD